VMADLTSHTRSRAQLAAENLFLRKRTMLGGLYHEYRLEKKPRDMPVNQPPAIHEHEFLGLARVETSACQSRSEPVAEYRSKREEDVRSSSPTPACDISKADEPASERRLPPGKTTERTVLGCTQLDTKYRR